jgi:hypothetical protein
LIHHESSLSLLYSLQWYGECFAVIGAVLLIGWLSFGFFFLYSARDAYEWCTFCKYLSCLPTPWWTCPSNVPLCQFTNGTSSYIGPCPTTPLP